MNDSRKRIIIGVSIVAVAVLLLGLLLFMLFRPEKVDENANRSMDVTSFYSPLTKSSDSLTVNYGGEANPNRDAVKQQFRIFNPGNLPMPQNARDALGAVLQDALLSKVTPTYPVTYVHVVRDSVKCEGNNSCIMNLYIDSPETYFEFKLKDAGGIPSYEITQVAWKGIN